MRYTIWYHDGSKAEFGSVKEWESIPSEFVQIIKPKGKGQGHMGGSYYVMLDDETIIDFGVGQRWKYLPDNLKDHDPDTVDQELRKLPRWKFGKWLSDTDYSAIRDEAFG